MPRIIFSCVLFLFCFGNLYSQNIAVNTSGAAAAAANMFEVTQSSATNNTVGLFSKHTGAATNAYAIWAEVSGAANKYALVVPSGGGYVGVGTSTPATFLELQGNNINYIGQLRLSATDYTQISFYNSGALTANATNRLGDIYYDIAGTALNIENNSGNKYVNLNQSGGNVGIGTAVPGAKLSFQDLNNGANTADGITWYNPAPTAYGIFRSPGAWSAPNYQQLSFAWQTGIVIDGGSAYGLSGTVLQPTAGNVGIGITAPLEKLHVVGNTRISTLAGTGTRMVQADANGTMLPLSAGTATQVLLGTGAWGSVPGGSGNYIQNQTTLQATSNYNISGSGNVQTSYQLQGVNVLFNAATDVYGNIRVLQNNSTALQDGMYINYNSTGGAGADLRFYANGVNERMRILASNGNVGIGTLGPGTKLDISGGGGGTVDLRVNGRIQTGDAGAAGGIWLSNASDGFVGNNGLNIGFWTNGAGWNAFQIIKASGYVGIGTTTPACKLQVIGRIMTDNMNQTSDARLKKNIVTIDNALSKITSVRGVYFNWKTDIARKRDADTTLQMGVIAQEIEKIFPELVHTDNEGYKSVEYSNMVAVLIEAIKEQQKQIEKLQAETLLSAQEIKNLKEEMSKTKTSQQVNVDQSGRMEIKPVVK